MKRKILSLVLLTAMALSIIAGLTSCGPLTPAGAWKKAATGFAEAKNVSLNAKVTFGKILADVEYISDREASVKSYDIVLPKDKLGIYTDGNTNYYTIEDMNFSVKSSDDSVIFKEFLGFVLTNADRLVFDEKDLMDAVLTEEESSKTLEFKVSGEAFKNAIAPDEDITFTEVTIKSTLDSDNNFKYISITTTAKGNEFYGLPLIDAVNKEAELNVILENIDFSGAKKPVEPKEKTEYPESAVLAKIVPSAVFTSLKNSSKTEEKMKMEMTVAGNTAKTESESTTTLQYIGDDVYMRTITDTTQWSGGNKQIDSFDEYFDGKKGYLYYSDYSTKYKLKFDEEDLGLDNTEDENLMAVKDLFNSGVINGDTISFKLSLNDLKGIVGEEDFEESFGKNGISLDEANLKIKLKDGFIDTYSFDFKMSVTTSGVTVKVDADFEIKYFDIREEHTVTAPSGYEYYPDLF